MKSKEFQIRIIEQDLLALNEQLAESPVTRAHLRRLILLLGTILALLALFAAINQRWVSAMLFAAATFLVPFALPPLVRMSRRNYVRKVIRQGNPSNLLGPRSIRVATDALEVTYESGYLGIFWHGIDRISVTPTHVFIFTSPISALIVPRRELSESDFEELVRLITTFAGEMTDQLSTH